MQLFVETPNGFLMSEDTVTEHFGNRLEKGDTVRFDGRDYRVVGLSAGFLCFRAIEE